MIDQLNLFEHWNFNSRSLRRSDGCRGIYIIGNHKFQFSFPTWGAIVFVTLHLLIIQNFNSRFLRGSDIYSNSAASKAFYFNSRSLRVERYHGISAAGAPVDFNSRPLRGER